MENNLLLREQLWHASIRTPADQGLASSQINDILNREVRPLLGLQIQYRRYLIQKSRYM